MQKILRCFSIPTFFLIFPFLSVSASETNDRLLIADFESQEGIKHLSTWQYNVLDSEQSIDIKIIDKDVHGKEEKVLQLDFDVDSNNPAMVGVWIKLEDQDLSGYEFLNITLKSDGTDGFMGNIALQFKDKNKRKAPYLLSGISKEWKEHRIPLEKFRGINNWSGVAEFEIIFDDMNAQPKEGVLYIAEVYAF